MFARRLKARAGCALRLRVSVCCEFWSEQGFVWKRARAQSASGRVWERWAGCASPCPPSGAAGQACFCAALSSHKRFIAEIFASAISLSFCACFSDTARFSTMAPEAAGCASPRRPGRWSQSFLRAARAAEAVFLWGETEQLSTRDRLLRASKAVYVDHCIIRYALSSENTYVFQRNVSTQRDCICMRLCQARRGRCRHILKSRPPETRASGRHGDPGCASETQEAETDGQIARCIDRQTNRQTDRHTDRVEDKQVDIQTGI